MRAGDKTEKEETNKQRKMNGNWRQKPLKRFQKKPRNL